MSEHKIPLVLSTDERKKLTLICITAISTTSRLQRKWFDEVFVQLQLDGYEHELQTRSVILPDPTNDDTPESFELNLDAAKFLVNALENAEIRGSYSRAALRISTRLREALPT